MQWITVAHGEAGTAVLIEREGEEPIILVVDDQHLDVATIGARLAQREPTVANLLDEVGD